MSIASIRLTRSDTRLCACATAHEASACSQTVARRLRHGASTVSASRNSASSRSSTTRAVRAVRSIGGRPPRSTRRGRNTAGYIRGKPAGTEICAASPQRLSAGAALAALGGPPPPIDETCQKIGCFDPRHACRNVDLRVVPRTLGEAVDDQSQEVVAGTCVVGGRAAGEIRLSIDTQMRQRADPVACDEADPRVPDLFPASRCTHICLHLSLYTRRILHMYRDYYGHSTLYAYRGIESVALMHLCHTLGVGGSSPTAPFLAQYPVGRWVSLTDGAT